MAAEGGQKRVYRAWNTTREKFEALAVIDVRALEKNDKINSKEGSATTVVLITSYTHTYTIHTYAHTHIYTCVVVHRQLI